uniref:Uncharacterized protein n=1 Tax=Timema shepardi TaxID=629360 RepID=A0A7R9G3I6_TIMSH|nr:unnamed protein product [Timema shepardi]
MADQMMQYVRSLERRVKQLEEEKVTLQQKVGQSAAPVPEVHGGWDTEGGSRPEAVVQALQVLEVREKIERGNTPEQQQQSVLETNTAGLDDGEKALVREMLFGVNSKKGQVTEDEADTSASVTNGSTIRPNLAWSMLGVEVALRVSHYPLMSSNRMKLRLTGLGGND